MDENEEVLCLWRADFDEEAGAVIYGMDIFSRVGELWDRSGEEHIEYAHSPEAISKLLSDSGFVNIRLRRDGPQGGSGRLFICAVRK